VLHFEWDAAKNERNIRIHGIDFADAAPIFDAPMFTWADTRKAYGEARTVGLGLLIGRVMAFAFTVRGPDLVRWISVRKANDRETKRYVAWVAQQNQQGQ
jgi:uncharacterized protein